MERYAPDDPREWLNRARSNLVLARMQEAGVYLEDLCFHIEGGSYRPERSAADKAECVQNAWSLLVYNHHGHV
jgi:hypothetical protein